MPSEEPLRVGETLHLGKADWVYGDRAMRVRVSDIRYGHDDPHSPVIGILATVVGAGRDGRMVSIAVYKSALTHTGVREAQRRHANGVDPEL
ncbi:hypothetical protein O7632_16305 [Solwaraspora sp. WMMD406]|uniref:hypothetical protein n=1 Tax=Solwaraspora sp. WMMD406 TaxID=3016095 RepID=UPI0024173082|nr:hypothetical protein [Solwaraspora sp. WMMD406]MDG4765649.1 hypothetical protein [Solwaraspora sp. WMMD406]